MPKVSDISLDQELNDKCSKFIKKIDSDMHYHSKISSGLMEFDWVNEFETACPYIDNIVRNPKVALIKEEDVVKIEKAKKVSVASVKDLAVHTHYIDTVDPVTEDVQPNKLLIERSEETFNTYENRYIYTLIDNLTKFVLKQEKLLEHFEVQNSKALEYRAATNTGYEKVDIEVKITAIEIPKENEDNALTKELEEIKKRIKRIKAFVNSWNKCEMVSSLTKAHVPFVIPPIKKTNLILKNPNFQMATRLWNFLQNYDDPDNDGSKDALDTEGNDLVKSILDDAFLMDFYVLDSISKLKRMQKEKLFKYAVVMIHQQIQRVISLLINSGYKITDEQILDLIARGIKEESTKTAVDISEVKKKFQSALGEFLEKTKKV